MFCLFNTYNLQINFIDHLLCTNNITEYESTYENFYKRVLQILY